MGERWSADLTYHYYGRILEVLKAGYVPILLRDAPARVKGEKPHVIIRHDVDVSPAKALELGGIERDHGIRATYMFLTNSPLYSLTDSLSASCFPQLRELGHEIALHFDLSPELRNSGCSVERVREEILAAADILARASGGPVESVSFHRPISSFVRGPLTVAGMVNAYAAEYMAWYLSDSDAGWREGEPIPQLRQPRHDLLQLLVHPIWWGEQHLSAGDRLAEFHRQACRDESDDFGREFRERIFAGIGLYPSTGDRE